MNDYKIIISNFGNIIDRISKDTTFEENCALYAAARAMYCELIEAKYGETDCELSSYGREKLRKLLFHISATIGFDIENGQSKNDHIIEAFANKKMLEKVLSELSGDVEG